MKLLRPAIALALAALLAVPAEPASPRPDRDLYNEALAALNTLRKSPKRQAKKTEWESVVLRFRRVVARYPQSAYCDDALLNVGDLYRDMAKRFRSDRYEDDAEAAYRALVAEYPSSSKGEDALYAMYEMARADKDRKRIDVAGRAYLEAYPRGAKAAVVKTQLQAARTARSSAPPTAGVPVRVREVELALPTTPPAGVSTVYDLRFWSGETSTRVVIDLEKQVPLESDTIHDPDRLWIDLVGTRLHPNLKGRAFPVGDGLLEQIRVAQNRDNVVRVVLDFKDVKDHQVFWLQNPLRLVVDVRAAEPKPAPDTLVAVATPPPARPVATPAPAPTATPRPSPTPSAPPRVAVHATPSTVPAFATPLPRATVAPTMPGPSPTPYAEVVKLPARRVNTGPAPDPATPTPPPVRTARVHEIVGPTPKPPKPPKPSPTPKPTRVASKASPSPSPRPSVLPPVAPAAVIADRRKEPARNLPPQSPEAPQQNRTGSYSLARQLGLTARRIVIDAGHGGHDPGSIGPGGLQEKDLTLDVALRLERLIREELGAEVILTRSTDVFIPLEERTAIANSKGADLFLSIHANSSRNPKSRGVETYFLNFAADPHAEAVAARENAISAATMKDLQNLVKAITLNSKIDESRDFAASVQEGLMENIRPIDPEMPNRGVRTAPFYVLIGANMPSVLAEIAFVSNPTDEKHLKTPERRQVIAESLFDGLQRYLSGLNRSTKGRQLTRSGPGSTVASRGSRR